MSEEADAILCCASCGVAGGDDVKLKRCNGCYLVRYCGIECQRRHRREHKKECKKRAAELRDELLFKQPESSYLGDCPICCLPLLPMAMDGKLSLQRCCSKRICNGCFYAHTMHEIEEKLENKCPFCRYPMLFSDEEGERILMKRVEANDPVALCDMGEDRAHEGDFESAFECFTKAVAFGNNTQAHFQLSRLYHEGQGVEKDTKKELYHLEEAAIGGHADGRHNLGCVENDRGRLDRAVKHWVIAANMGNDDSLEALKKLYRKGLVSKDDLASALRAHHAAVEATKSPQREEARMSFRNMKMKMK